MFRRQHKLESPVWDGQKPKLPALMFAVFRVGYRDLEKYLNLVYKMEGYSVRSATGAKGAMTPEINVTGTLPEMANICQLVDNIRMGRHTRNLGLIMDLLCQDGFIPAGKYIIDMTEIKTPVETYADLLNDLQDCLHPKCIQFKDKYKEDIGFMKQVKLLDAKLLKHQEGLANIASKTVPISEEIKL